ncbi:thymidine phosphorylase-like isoform X2 [Mercenaria mercenaria]|uniref:thymidine phosphorylase-like isoform X2 n=1 Tax=Mercenaria mercenaria TaxID=6596 RepID=UPI001E1D79C5|nr:thymidine phosphorylase-like isoform X2 [Mercenaria mercenaria]
MSQNYQRQDSCGNNNVSISDLIGKKRDGLSLREEEIEYFVRGVVEGTIQEAQIGAMLMAMFIRSLDNEETTNLTRAMTHSGDVLRWPDEWKGSVVDKHSTGGVGDKVSLVLAPALAACGVKVPMVSGRGLGHTGGTLDKLESIPGFNVSLSHEAMLQVMKNVGCCIVGQTSNLVPADKILYATRDVTSTTENIGLITSSIISKKVAESLDALVLDVKIGKGAFLKDEQSARELATRMVKAGNGSGVKTVALLTDMDSPLGHMVGNALEVAESIHCLHGDGPQDLTDLVIRLGGQLLFKAGHASGLQEAYNIINGTLHNGTAIAKFAAMMKAQGVKADLADRLCEKGVDVFEILPRAKHSTQIKSEMSGYVHDIDAMKCAVVTGKLGAGRTKAGEAISFGVGLHLSTHVGKHVEKDTTWMTVYHNEEKLPDMFVSMLEDALNVRPEPVKTAHKGTRVVDVIT